MYRFKIFIFLFFPLTMISQHITGKVYDAETSVKGAKIFNKNANSITYTNETGSFKINALINDTLIFTSLFHKDKILRLTSSHFENVIVVELKKVINTLDEVLLANEVKDGVFNRQTYTSDFGLQIKNDIKNNPYKYKPLPSSNLDFIKISSLIGKLFKKKNKDTPIIIATYKSFDSLFKNDAFFNKELLTNQLQIQEAYKTLFFDYCDNKQMDNTLLKKENRVILLDSLFNCSKEFLDIVKNSERDSLKN